MVFQMNKINIPMDNLGLHNLTPVSARDPLDLNRQIQAGWSSVVGEPDGLTAPEWSWKLSSEIYNFVQAATYRGLVVILAPILSFFAAIFFGILHFLQIWFLRPVLKFFHIVFSFTRSFLELILHGTIGPVLETFGLLLARVKIRHQRVYEAKDEAVYPFII